MSWEVGKKSKKKYPLKRNGDFYPVTTTRKGHPRCPNCGGSRFIFGPEGGASQNIQCVKCYKFWNYMGPFGFQDIGDRSEVFGIKPPGDAGQEA